MEQIKSILKNKWFKFGVVASLYLLWVIWLQNWWWLLGLVIIYDMYITKKVKWAFWKKKYKEGEKRNFWLDWLDAAIFALIAATFIRIFFIEAYTIPTPSMEKSLLVGDYLFVSKIAYGPKMPNTPLSIPLVHNRLDLFGIEKPYSELIKCDYKRLLGFGHVKRGDVVVFNYPCGDTVIKQAPNEDYVDYYGLCRALGREKVLQAYEITVRPVDKKDNYVKRCVALPGDSLAVRQGVVYVNGHRQEFIPGMQFNYNVVAKGGINPLTLDKLGISMADQRRYNAAISTYMELPLTDSALNQIKTLPNVTSISRKETTAENGDALSIFPHDSRFMWSEDNYGTIWIPKKGVTILLTLDNMPLYRRLITVYEGNTLEVKGGDLYINGQLVTTYTFKMDYYWMMGDNRNNSLDSRFWGFVPEDHIVGKASFIWFSSDMYKSFPKNIRWSRMFKWIK